VIFFKHTSSAVVIWIEGAALIFIALVIDIASIVWHFVSFFPDSIILLNVPSILVVELWRNEEISGIIEINGCFGDYFFDTSQVCSWVNMGWFDWSISLSNSFPALKTEWMIFNLTNSSAK